MSSRFKYVLGRSVILAAVAGGLACSVFVACGGDDDLPDTVVVKDATVADSTVDGTTASLYDRLGKNAGVKAMVDKVMAAELADCMVGPYFVEQTGSTSSASPSLDQLKECLTAQFSKAFGGPEAYPTTVDGGYTCRDMKLSHAGSNVNQEIYTRFLTIAANVALSTQGFTASDTAALTTLFGPGSSVAGDIVVDAATLPNSCDAGTTDAVAADATVDAAVDDAAVVQPEAAAR